jgi:uncharacterized GH25 family protein
MGYAKDRAIELRATHRDYGGVATATIQAGSDESVVLRLDAAVVVQGRVLDSEGQPIEGVTVTLSSAARATPGVPPSAPIAGTTNADGVFVIRQGVAGERLVRFDHAQYRIQSRTLNIPSSKERFDAGTTRLDRGLGLGGRVLDANGVGVPGVMVTAAFLAEGGAKTQVKRTPSDERTNASVASDSEGRFSMRGLLDGPYRITAMAAGRYSTSPTARTGAFDVVVTLKNPQTIHGRVLSGGKPVQGAWIQATQPGPTANQPRWLASVSTDKDGAFALGPLPPEERFTLKVVHNEYRPLELPDTTAATAPAEYALDTGSVITGVVVDEEGRAVANANLSVIAAGEVRSNASKWARTKEDGSFRLSGLERDRYRVTVASTPAFHVPSEPVEIEADGEPLRIALAPGRRIKGTLQADDPMKLGQVRIVAIDSAGTTRGTAWVWGPRSFTFTLSALPAGTYVLKVVRGWPPDEETLIEVTGVEAGEENVEVNVHGK